MGALTGRDSNIVIYMNVNKPYYIAGEYVQGQIYLDVKKDSNYGQLCVRLQGEQHVFWSEHHGKYDNRFYTNTYKSYDSQFPISDFHGILPAGQYLFPFSFLLPSMITGSFYSSSSCYLKYTLSAQLLNSSSERKTQIYSMFLNILQPPRMPVGFTSLTNSVNSKCCGCCKDYGITTVSLASERNFVRNGDKINVKARIDNTHGKVAVDKARVYFQQTVIKIADNNYNVDYSQERNVKLHTAEVSTPAGEVQQFSFVAQIPNDIIDYTAIGRVVARYFVLHLETSYGCCANTSQAYLHLIVHSKTPCVVEKKVIPTPPGWNPKIYPKVVFEQMKPYLYQPMPQIPFLNMPGNETVSTNIRFDQNMASFQNMMGYQLGQIAIKANPQEYQYSPIYYDQDGFTQEQRIQQGYQPYFVNNNAQSQVLLMNKKK